MMDAAQFRLSAKGAGEPPAVSAPLLALWWMARGDWERAHSTAQADHTKDGAWVHGHLHRVEGDLGNAAYWYGQGGKTPSTAELDQEWDAIATELLAREA